MKKPKGMVSLEDVVGNKLYDEVQTEVRAKLLDIMHGIFARKINQKIAVMMYVEILVGCAGNLVRALKTDGMPEDTGRTIVDQLKQNIEDKFNEPAKRNGEWEKIKK